MKKKSGSKCIIIVVIGAIVAWLIYEIKKRWK